MFEIVVNYLLEMESFNSNSFQNLIRKTSDKNSAENKQNRKYFETYVITSKYHTINFITHRTYAFVTAFKEILRQFFLNQNLKLI